MESATIGYYCVILILRRLDYDEDLGDDDADDAADDDDDDDDDDHQQIIIVEKLLASISTIVLNHYDQQNI